MFLLPTVGLGQAPQVCLVLSKASPSLLPLCLLSKGGPKDRMECLLPKETLGQEGSVQGADRLGVVTEAPYWGDAATKMPLA